MLSKEKRLNLKKDFTWVASGKKITHPFFILFIRSGSNSLPRVGITASKSIFKKAVGRNRARRLVSAAVESLYDTFLKDINIIILPSSKVINVTSKEIEKELKSLFQKEGLINDKNNSDKNN